MSPSKLKTAAGVTLILAAAIFVLWQRRTLTQLTFENARLREQNLQLDELERLRRERWELDRFRDQAREVHGLRNRVAQLLREKVESEDERQRLQQKIGKYEDVEELLKQKEIVRTGEPLDIAIAGAGFFEVQMEDGTQGYTRDGRFKTSEDGRVVTADGLTVLSGLQPVPRSTTEVLIKQDGQVTLASPNGNTNYRIHLTRFKNPGGLELVGRNLVRETTASGPPETGNPSENGLGELAQGYREALP